MVLTSSVSPVVSLVARSVDVGVTDRLFLWLLGVCVCVCVRERERDRGRCMYVCVWVCGKG